MGNGVAPAERSVNAATLIKNSADETPGDEARSDAITWSNNKALRVLSRGSRVRPFWTSVFSTRPVMCEKIKIKNPFKQRHRLISMTLMAPLGLIRSLSRRRSARVRRSDTYSLWLRSD